MKIQYVGNTCDVDGIEAGGEILIIFKDGKIVHHHDYSDGSMELDYFESLLESIDVDVKFESIEPTEEQITQINEYLEKQGY